MIPNCVQRLQLDIKQSHLAGRNWKSSHSKALHFAPLVSTIYLINTLTTKNLQPNQPHTNMANAVHVDSTKHFNSYLQNTEYVVVDFTASWCGPCRTIAPIYEKLAKEHTQPGKIAFLKVDVDEQQEVAQYYNITA